MSPLTSTVSFTANAVFTPLPKAEGRTKANRRILTVAEHDLDEIDPPHAPRVRRDRTPDPRCRPTKSRRTRRAQHRASAAPPLHVRLCCRVAWWNGLTASNGLARSFDERLSVFSVVHPT
jgi:hypothetical protein